MRHGTGSYVGVVIGEALIQVAAHELHPGWAEWPVRVLGALAGVGAALYVIRQTGRRTDRVPRDRPRAMRTWLLSVAAAVVAIAAGFWLFNQVLPVTELILPWVVMIVGLQFIPFASAFHTEQLERMGAIVFLVGMVGGAFTLYFRPEVGAWSSVAAGLVTLGFSAYAALGPDRLRRPA